MKYLLILGLVFAASVEPCEYSIIGIAVAGIAFCFIDKDELRGM